MALKFQKLTRNSLKALQAGSRINEHGITVERLRNGDLRYTVNVMVDGQRIHRVVGKESEGVTREQGEQLIERFRTDARADRVNLPAGRKTYRKFATSAAEYIQRLEATDGKDMVNKRRHLHMYIVPYFNSSRINQITDFSIKQYRRTRLEAGASDATINREFSTLMHFFNRATDWKWMARDVGPRIERARKARKRIRGLTDEQGHILMEAAIAD